MKAPGYINDAGYGEFALSSAMKIIDGFSDYFNLNYTQSFRPGRAKSDQIGIADFTTLGEEQGKLGKENWGLVTYQFNLIYMNRLGLLKNFSFSSVDMNFKPILSVNYYESSISSVAEVMSHALVQQWTGNLVTCKWWDELWLNKAFADLGGYLGLRYVEPSWNWQTEFTVYELFNALEADSSVNSRTEILDRCLLIWNCVVL